MEIVLNTRYSFLELFVKNIPVVFDSIGDIIQNYRNDIRVCKVGNLTLVIKSFKGMYFPNQIAYSIFRKSKAQRSYEASMRLLKNGIAVPEPVAFIDCFRLGLLTQSYFISVYYEHVSFNEMLKDDENKEDLLLSFAEFTYILHQNYIYHDDYSNGNILCTKNDDKISFALVDLNRVQFRNVNFWRGVRNFSKLDASPAVLEVILNRYAELHGRTPENALRRILSLRSRRGWFSKWRKMLKAVFYPGRIRQAGVQIVIFIGYSV